MRASIFALVILAVGGCTETSQGPSDTPTRGYALRSTAVDGRMTIALSGDDPRADATRVLAREKTDFGWISVEFPTHNSDGSPIDLTTPVTFDVTDASRPVTFAQNYLGVCDPTSRAAPTHCRFVEVYSTGDPGFTGSVVVQLDAAWVMANFDVNWVGLTDRFGPANVDYGHSTRTGYFVGASRITEMAQ